ncbi:hypothetical protein [Ramlibacter sp. WS9]|uniref:hypothetical protein n=1 Tax=Ramlibacter sp. WS9 TaxID=1882741 RepID=UPI0011415EF5|nr:hypothetical protein [Ramlibacter sp. WS9]ROZ77118.1 hypothetical protein EEB15_11125 [Ramlibacter sp. WS9]
MIHPESTSNRAAQPLWAVTSYYNPAGFERRKANYHLFRERLPLPLLTVEWSPTGKFELRPGDADILIQLTGGNVMWQKERLLNVGVTQLPPQCTHVAWVDCDLIFEREDLGQAILAALDAAPLVQLFDRIAYLARTPLDAMPRLGSRTAPDVTFERQGAAAAHAAAARSGQPAAAVPVATEHPDDFKRMPCVGFAWAARREHLERHPLFDEWVVGGGDSAHFHAAAGTPERVVENHGLASPHRDQYLPRARELANAIGGRIGHVAGRAFTLWHGNFADRRYRSRHSILARHGFDPRRFLQRSASGVWEWADVPHGLPDEIRAYFEQRNEDGLVTASA